MSQAGGQPAHKSLTRLGRDVHVIGIRSKTRLTERVLREARNLLVVGCFCIGTNQVDLEYAARNGIAVFNSPFSNSRSVAELMIGWIIMLARQLGDRSSEMHRGTWNKVSARCWEVRGKTLGIVGYGHIGSQLSVLAEAMGMTVIYYDIVTLMPHGKARQVRTLEAPAGRGRLRHPARAGHRRDAQHDRARPAGPDEDGRLPAQRQPRRRRRPPGPGQRHAQRQDRRRRPRRLPQRARRQRRLLQRLAGRLGRRLALPWTTSS